MKQASQVDAAGLRAGFTLIELMAVIIVLGMIAGTVSVSWKALVPRTQLNSQVRELLEFSRLNTVFAIHESEEDALRSFAG